VGNYYDISTVMIERDMMNLINGYVIDTLPKGVVNELGGEGEYRAVTKCRAGFPTIYDIGTFDNPLAAFNRVQPKALLNLQYRPTGCEHWLCLYARKGNKVVVVDEALLR